MHVTKISHVHLSCRYIEGYCSKYRMFILECNCIANNSMSDWNQAYRNHVVEMLVLNKIDATKISYKTDNPFFETSVVLIINQSGHSYLVISLWEDLQRILPFSLTFYAEKLSKPKITVLGYKKRSKIYLNNFFEFRTPKKG